MEKVKATDRKRTYHVFVDKSIGDSFEQAYPHCRSRFITNAMKLCLSDKNLFDKIFFCDLLSNGV